MKVLKFTTMLLAAAALSIGTHSCSDDSGSSDKKNQPSAELLSGHWSNVASDDYTWETLSFNAKSDNSITYEYSYDLDDDNEYEIIANGTYTLNGASLKAAFSMVSVYTSTGSKSYKGFTDGQPLTVDYTIRSCDGSKLLIESGGSIKTFEKYMDIKK